MNGLGRLAARSSWHRRGTLALVAASIALATMLLLSIERMRADVQASFSQAVSGTDLIVGARTGPVQLMLYAVFRMGGATNNIRMASVDAIAAQRSVAWVVPVSLGDSHRGYPVMGTTSAYFDHFRHGEQQSLSVRTGRPFQDTLEGLYEAVLGAEVARRLGYAVGDTLVLSHGSGQGPASEHGDKPFTVVGVLAPTGTPVDRTVHVSLPGLQAVHLNWVGGGPVPGLAISAEQARKFDLRPTEVTAALVGLRSRAAVFRVQREINAYADEALMAVLPGVALAELWQVIGVGEQALLAVSALVAVVSLAGLVAVVLAGLNERRRELAVLRAVGAAPRHILALLMIEGILVNLAGVVSGCLLSLGFVMLAGPWMQSRFGIMMQTGAAWDFPWWVVAGVMLAGVLASLIPALRAYQLSLADGLAPRI